MNKIITLWATCRSRSTAFERMMFERGDMHIFHEPFGRYYYFSSERQSQRAEHIIPAPEYEFEYILNSIFDKAARQTVFIKEQAFQAEKKISDDVLLQLSNTFLLRHPQEVIPSMHNKLADFNQKELGYRSLFHIFERVQQLSGKPPLLIDSDDLITCPEKVAKAYCRAVGIPFIAEALTWEPSLPPEFVWWDDGSWLKDVGESSSFKTTLKKYAEIEGNSFLQAAYDESMPYYEKMIQYKLNLD